MSTAPTLSTTAFTDGPADGRPLLLLGPSLGTSTEALWRSCAERLREDFHVVGWDLPGHGASAPATSFDIPALASALLAVADDAAGVGSTFYYAGDSMGGAVGLQLLLDAPERVIAATLLCTAARIAQPASWRERAATVRAHGTGSLLPATPARWFGPGFAERQPVTSQALLDALSAADDESYATACEALADFDLRRRLHKIAPPVTAVAGAWDPVITTAEMRRVATGVQRGRLVVLDDVAHLAPAEAPERVAQLIVKMTAFRDPSTTTAEVRASGMHVRREVLGDTHVDQTTIDTSDFTREFQDFITQYAWGTIWTRPGLDRRSRSLITLTALVARGHHEELAMHLRAARRNGLTDDEIKELLLQTAIYCGVPDANTAFRIARDVLAQPGADQAGAETEES
jgi:3-oxoadipate enol-lactonase/4-carboxymuconolactone decarboxylase